MRRSLSYPISDQKTKIRQLNVAFQVAFGLIALTLVFWGVVRSAGLWVREDNPRQVEAALRVRRGSIVDRNNIVLAQSVGDERVVREYALGSGAAVGYYSFRYGANGVEEGFDPHLQGDASVWDEWLHRPKIGRSIRLTIDARWQISADTILGDNKGAIVLLSLPDHALRAMASHPVYDPNLLDEQFETLVDAEDAPLLNRVTQGQYQPGTVLTPFLLATFLDENRIELDQAISSGTTASPLLTGENVLPCATLQNVEVWRDVLATACPTPLATQGSAIGVPRLTQIFTDYGFLAEVVLPVATDLPESEPMVDPLLAIVGQENMTVTPLQVARAWAGLATGGEQRNLQLVSALENAEGDWEVRLVEDERVRMVSAESAATIIDALPQVGTIIEFTALALSGPEGELNAWYLGLAPANDPRFALVVVLENGDSERVQQIGRDTLNAVFSP